jgi:hypothetical protein
MKTAMQEIINFFDGEADMGFCSKKYAERAKWYISTYFLPKERQQIEDAWNTAHQAGRFEGKGIAEENWQTFDKYFTEKFEQ